MSEEKQKRKREEMILSPDGELLEIVEADEPPTESITEEKLKNEELPEITGNDVLVLLLIVAMVGGVIFMLVSILNTPPVNSELSKPVGMVDIFEAINQFLNETSFVSVAIGAATAGFTLSMVGKFINRK